MDRSSRAFGVRLRDLRGKRGLTMRELAERASISYNYVRSMESGAKSVPHTDVLMRLADVLGVSTDELLGRTPISEAAQQAQMLEMLQRSAIERRLGEEVSVRVIGTVPADGFRWLWQEGEQISVGVSMSLLKGRSQDDVFGLRVSGNCLRALHIIDGDIVICEWSKGRRPQNDDLVVVRIGSELTLKIWQWQNDEVELRDGDGRVVFHGLPDEELYVEGFVLGVERDLSQQRGAP